MMKIIPAIDLMGGQVVRLYRGDPGRKTVYGDDPVGVARGWERDGADMLHVVDLDATLGTGPQRRRPAGGDAAEAPAAAAAPAHNAGTIRRILDAVSIPVQVAGGLRSGPSVLEMSGIADRVVVGTLAFEDRGLLASLLASLGPERIVISADHRDGRVVTRGWRRDTGVPLADALAGFAGMGFTEFLLTDVSRDGTLGGPELESLGRACGGTLGINVIASGGISGVGDVKRVMERGAHGVILGKALYEGMVSVREAKDAVAAAATTTTTTAAAGATGPPTTTAP